MVKALRGSYFDFWNMADLRDVPVFLSEERFRHKFA